MCIRDSGKRVELFQYTYRYGDTVFVRDVVHFGQSVAVVPFKDNKNVLLIKQYRAPVGKWILEVPAGRVEHHETPEQAAVRELREEVGYEAAYLRKLVSLYLSPGYSDEIIHIYIAKKLTYVGASPEKGEILRVIEMPLDMALKAVLSEDVVDAKTIIALLIAEKYVADERSEV